MPDLTSGSVQANGIFTTWKWVKAPWHCACTGSQTTRIPSGIYYRISPKLDFGESPHL